jgi:membrane protein implicated in regulation of membrane protease activity
MPVFLRYCLYELPGCVVAAAVLAAAVRWAGLDAWLAWGLFAVWVLKELLLYPFLKKAYGHTPSRLVGVELMIGANAVCEETLSPSGYVRVRGERWHAEALEPKVGPIPQGSTVCVRSVQGLTLLVEPASDATIGCS